MEDRGGYGGWRGEWGDERRYERSQRSAGKVGGGARDLLPPPPRLS